MDRQDADNVALPDQPIGRRSLLKGAGAGALAVGAGGFLAACGSGIKGTGGPSTTGTINIGFITPLTGPLAGFASGDQFVLKQIRDSGAFKNGIKVGARKYKIKVTVVDSQSNPTRAGQVAQQLSLQNKVDIILTTSTPETTNPVAAQCEKQGTPCVSTVVPWESWYAGLGGNPVKPTAKFSYCTTFFFGIPQFAGCFEPMWKRIGTNGVVACMYPNDSDGNAFRGAFEPLVKSARYKTVDGGAYADGTTDYATMISQFKSKNCELFSCVPLPPDFNTFWKQASQQGFKPKLATVAKVLLFPADTKALGALVSNIATDAWWGPFMPYKSSLTGESAAALVSAYQGATGSEWVQSIGSTYSLFEVAREAFAASSDPHHAADVASALHKISYTGICGPLDFARGPAPGVGIIPPVGVQWKASTGKFPFELKVVDNTLNPSVKIQASLERTNA